MSTDRVYLQSYKVRIRVIFCFCLNSSSISLSLTKLKTFSFLDNIFLIFLYLILEVVQFQSKQLVIESRIVKGPCLTDIGPNLPKMRAVRRAHIIKKKHNERIFYCSPFGLAEEDGLGRSALNNPHL